MARKDKDGNIQDWRSFNYPTGLSRLVYTEQTKISAYWEIIHLKLKSIDEELTQKNLHELRCRTDDNFPDQMLIYYQNHLLGLIYYTEDIFDNFINFDSDLKDFK